MISHLYVAACTTQGKKPTKHDEPHGGASSVVVAVVIAVIVPIVIATIVPIVVAIIISVVIAIIISVVIAIIVPVVIIIRTVTNSPITKEITVPRVDFNARRGVVSG